MERYYYQVTPVRRSAGQNVVAQAVNHGDQPLACARTGQLFEPPEVGPAYNCILAPVDAPAWARDREKLWGAVELRECRRDAQLALAITATLPAGLPLLQARDLVRTFAWEVYAERGLVVDLAIRPIQRDRQGRLEAHLLVTLRPLSANGFQGKIRTWMDKQLLDGWREHWNTLAARASAAVPRPAHEGASHANG